MKPLPATCPPFTAVRSGQASVELIAGIVLFLILVTGLIHVNRMARTSLFLHSVIRGMAGEQAMEDAAVSSAPKSISDWQAGTDGDRYTADDQPVINGVAQSSILNTLVDNSVKNQTDWDTVADKSKLSLSMISLHASPNLVTAVGFVHVEETLYVPVDSVIRQLVYDKDEVAIKEEVWMPLMGGLY